MSKPTPRPWEYVGIRSLTVNNFTVHAIALNHKHGSWEAVFTKTKEDAAHIVKCVNMHDDLVEMLKQCEAMLVIDGHTARNGQNETAFLRLVRAVLAKAGAK